MERLSTQNFYWQNRDPYRHLLLLTPRLIKWWLGLRQTGILPSPVFSPSIHPCEIMVSVAILKPLKKKIALLADFDWWTDNIYRLVGAGHRYKNEILSFILFRCVSFLFSSPKSNGLHQQFKWFRFAQISLRFILVGRRREGIRWESLDSFKSNELLRRPSDFIVNDARNTQVGV
jgi:hypothetical protein